MNSKKDLIEYDAVQYYEVTPFPILNLPDIKELRCVKPKNDPFYLLYHCEPTKKYRGGCVCCGSVNHYSHGYAKDRLVHDISMGIIHVDLLVKTPRYKCNDCGATFVHQFESIVGSTQFTVRLYEQIKLMALTGTFDTIAKEFGTSITKISSIFSEYAKELEKKHKVKAPRVLGIDEKHIVHNARGVFVNIENGKLLEMTESNDVDTVIKTIESFENYDLNIQVVTIDMHRTYVNAVEICLPNAKIVIDKFHVVQNLYAKTASCRIKIVEHLKYEVEKLPEGNEKDYKRKLLTKLGKNVYLFKFGDTKLAEKPERIHLMTELCETFKELNTLRIIKIGAERIYKATSKEDAKKYYNEWKALIPQDQLFSDIKSFQRTMESWKEYIFNYFEEGCQYTNAATEGVNSMIGHLNDLGRGYKFETLRIKALYHQSSNRIPKRENKKSQLFDFKV